MMDSAWQIGAVVLAVAGAAVYLARRTFRFLSARSGEVGCSNCGTSGHCRGAADNGHARPNDPRSLPLVLLNDEAVPSRTHDNP